MPTGWRRLFLSLLAITLPVACGGADQARTDSADSGVSPSDAARESGAGETTACLAPGEAQLIYTTSAVCSGDGVFGAVQAGGCCSRIIPAVGDLSITLDGAGYQGPLAPCADVSPVGGLDLKLEIQQSQRVSDADGFSRAVLDGARMDVVPSCGHRLIVSSYKEQLVLAVGTLIEVRASTVVYASSSSSASAADDLVRTTTLILDAAAKPLLMVSVGATPPDIDTDLLPNLGLAVDASPVCRWAMGGGALTRIHLTEGGGADCALDSGTQRCCNLWGGTTEVRAQNAVRIAGREPADLVNVTLRRPGLFVSTTP